MGERYVTATVGSAEPVSFSIGDYLEYRGERFEINYDPTVIKQSEKGEYGNAFEYQNIKFNSLSDELTRCSFLDIVKEDNKIHYTSLGTFSFFCDDVGELADRIQANLDRVYYDEEKKQGKWTVTVNKEYVTKTNVNISVSNETVWSALLKVNSAFKGNFTVNGREITIGVKGDMLGDAFKYGAGGLLSIERQADSQQAVITRLRAYGNTTNMPERYYYKFTDKDGNQIVPNNLSISRLMLPSFPKETLDPYVDSDNIGTLGVREAAVIFDGSVEGYDDVYPTMENMTKEHLEASGVTVSLDDGDDGNLDEVVTADQLTDDGVPKSTETSSDDEIRKINYAVKSLFKITLKDIGFNLKEHLGTNAATISMTSGECAGREFEITQCVKDGNKYVLTCKRVYDESIKLYFPYKDYNIHAGDKFIFLNIEMPDVYIAAAAGKLKTYAVQYLEENSRVRYTYSPKIDPIYMQRDADKAATAGTASLHDEIREGMLFPIKDDDLGVDISLPISQLTIKEGGENTLPQYEVTVKEDVSAGTIERIQTAVNNIINGSVTIKNPDGDKQSAWTKDKVDKLVAEISGKLSKTSDDSAAGVITLLRGLLLGDGTHGIDKDGAARLASLLINGQYGIDSTGKGTLAALENSGDIRNTGGITTRDLTVTGAAHFFKLVIDEIKSAGGSLILTPANGFITEKVIHTDGDTHYKLLWKASDGQKSITNMWMAGDQAICMTDNLAAGTTYNASNRFWWVLVTDAGATTVDGTRYNYITVNFDRSAGAGAVSAGTPADIVPKVGDNVAMLGSRATDKDSGKVLTDRQNAVYIAAHGSLDTELTAPFMAFYRGITTFDLKKYRKTHFAPNSSAVIANNFIMTGDDYEAPVTTYLGEWTKGMTVPYGGVVSYNGRTWTCINPKGADGIEPTKQATAYWASNKGDSYDIAFSLNGVHVDTLNYDDVKAMESASLQVDFLNDGDPYTAAKATITLYDANSAVMGIPIELTDTTSDIIDGGNLYLSKDCKQITAVAYDAAGRQVVSKSLGVIRNGVDGTELVSLMLKVISGHTSWRAGQGTIATVAAYAMKGGYDITDAQDVSQFIWTRDSSDTTGDKNWNSQHTTGSKTLSVAEGDMVGDFTTFVCTLYNKNGKVVEVQKLDFQL